LIGCDWGADLEKDSSPLMIPSGCTLAHLKWSGMGNFHSLLIPHKGDIFIGLFLEVRFYYYVWYRIGASPNSLKLKKYYNKWGLVKVKPF